MNQNIIKNLYISIWMVFFIRSIRNAEWKKNQVLEVEWKVLSMEILDFVKDRHNSLDIESVSLNDIG